MYDKIELNWKLKISNNLNILKKIIYFSKSFFVILFSILSGFILDYVINKILWRNIIIDWNLLLSIYNNLSYFQVIWILFLAYISYYLFSTILNIKFNSVLYKNINDNEISEYRIYNFLNWINKLWFFSKLNFYFSNIKKYFSSAIEKDYWKFKNFSVLKKKKLVIVFDEMDKFYDKISINNNDETDKVELLFNIIGTLKYMFFNKWTDIHFIFIFWKEIYDYFRINLNTDDDLFTNIFSNIIYHWISKNEEVIFKNPLEDLNKKVNIDLNSYLYINHLCNLRHLNNKIENYYNIKEIINYKIPKKEDIEYVYNIFYNFIYLIIEYYLDKNFTYNSLIFYKRYIESNSGMFKNTFLNNVIKVSDNKINSIEILLKKDLSYRDYMINKLLKVKNYIIDQKWGYVDINETLQYFENWDKWLDNLYKEWYEDFKILLKFYIINIYIENSKSSNRKDLKIDNKNLYINLK